jgi:lipid-binding SYLF domain-containing protein
MRKILFLLMLVSLAVIPSTWAADAKGVNMKPKTAEEWQKYLCYRRDQALEDLYAIQPGAKNAVEKAFGYAVFSNFGMKIGFVGSGSGRGLVHDNKTGKETFMRMIQAGVGFGLGAKDFRLIFIFDNRGVMDQFINSGWSFGSQANASAKTEQQGAAASGSIVVAPGVSVYQLTENGLALEAMVNGTKYWVDKDVN